MGANIEKIFLMEENPQGELTINNLELEAYDSCLHIFSPLLKPLDHIATKVYNMAAEG